MDNIAIMRIESIKMAKEILLDGWSMKTHSPTSVISTAPPTEEEILELAEKNFGYISK